MPAVQQVWVEVTNTLAAHFTSGFQRHTRGLLAHLPTDRPDESGLLVTPVVWCAPCGGHRLLDTAEQDLLVRPPPPRPAPRASLERLAERLPIGGELLVEVGGRPWVNRAREAAARRRQGREHDPESHPPLVRFARGDVFFELEAGWHDPAPRDELLELLVGQGVRTGFLVADLMPEQHPEWFSGVTVERFGRFLRAHLRWSDHVASISRSTTRDLATVAGELGRTRPMQVVHVTMGADFDDAGARPPRSAGGPRTLLSVGSLEPRKNHALLIDVFDRVRERHADVELVLVGRETDLSSPLVERIRSHPEHGRRLRWEAHLDDAGLADAYSSAFLVLVPSRYEGYGIPVVEALSRGVATIAATGGALPEAGGDTAEYASADEPDAWVDLVELHLTDPFHHRAALERAAAFRPPTWEAAGGKLAAAFLEMGAVSS